MEYFDRFLSELKKEVLTDKTDALKLYFEKLYNPSIDHSVFTTEQVAVIHEIYKNEYDKRMEMEIPKCFESRKTTVFGTSNIFITVLDEFVHHYTKVKMYYIRQEHGTDYSLVTYDTVTHKKMIDILLSID